MRLFAMLRERAGAGEVVLELPEGARVAMRSNAWTSWPPGCRW